MVLSLKTTWNTKNGMKSWQKKINQKQSFDRSQRKGNFTAWILSSTNTCTTLCCQNLVLITVGFDTKKYLSTISLQSSKNETKLYL